MNKKKKNKKKQKSFKTNENATIHRNANRY